MKKFTKHLIYIYLIKEKTRNLNLGFSGLRSDRVFKASTLYCHPKELLDHNIKNLSGFIIAETPVRDSNEYEKNLKFRAMEQVLIKNRQNIGEVFEYNRAEIEQKRINDYYNFLDCPTKIKTFEKECFKISDNININYYDDSENFLKDCLRSYDIKLFPGIPAINVSFQGSNNVMTYKLTSQHIKSYIYYSAIYPELVELEIKKHYGLKEKILNKIKGK